MFPSDTPQWVKDQANDTGIVPEGYWYEVFGGCGAWSDESKDAIQHTEYCPGRNGGTVWIAEGSSDPTWSALTNRRERSASESPTHCENTVCLKGGMSGSSVFAKC